METIDYTSVFPIVTYMLIEAWTATPNVGEGLRGSYLETIARWLETLVTILETLVSLLETPAI